MVAGVVVLALLGAGAVGLQRWARARKEAARNIRSDDKRPKKPPHKIVVGVTDSGTAYPGFVANDGATAGVGSKFRAAGLDVEVRPIRGFRERLAAFDSGDVDVMLGTLDHVAQVAPAALQKNAPLRVFLLAGYSRGSIGIAALTKLKGLESLLTARTATTRSSPAHFFLAAMLRRTELPVEAQEKLLANLQFVSRAAVAVDNLKHGELDAGALQTPQLQAALEGGKARILVSTATASGLMPEVLFARESFLEEHQADVQTFVRIWLDGVAQAVKDPAQAGQAIARALQRPTDETRGALKGVQLAPFAGQRTFFGLGGAPSEFAPLFGEAGEFWQKERLIDQPVPANPVPWLHALEALQPAHANDPPVEEPAPKARSGQSPVLTHTMSIKFEPGEAELDEEARRKVDTLVPLLHQLGGAPVRVECNTDGSAHVPTYKITRLRAQAIIDYLVASHGFAKQRFAAVGNGAEKPLASDATPEGRDRNRRTDFVFLSAE
jgi:outer membrane protein OmpA-like peptidoglycan-associated protein/ABC-type taurine transport system substrate-binding protein